MKPLIPDLEINSTAMGWRTIMNCMRAKSSLALLFILFLAFGSAQAAPTYQAAGDAANAGGTNNNTSTYSVSPTWPAHQINDIALLFVETAEGRAVTLTTPAGFVEVPGSPQATGSGTSGTRLTVYWARATSTSMSAPTLSAVNHLYARILTYRGVIPTGNPWDVTGGAIKTPASNSVTVTGVTTTVDDTLIVQAVAHDRDNASAHFSNQSNANLSGITERTDGGTTSGNRGGFAVWDGVKATAGPTGNTTASISSSVENAFLTIALKPAPTVTSITRADANPSGATSVSWTVTFTAPVSGLAASNFTLVNTGLGGTPAITSVSGSGTTWTVTASTGTGSGTLGLNMVNTTGVTPAVAGLPFVGEVYSIPAPAVASMTLGSIDPTIPNTAVTWNVVFNVPVTGVDVSDFALVEAGGATGSSLTSVTGSGTTWTVTANSGTSDTGTLGLNLVDDDSIVSARGTPLGGTSAGNGNYVGPYYTLVPPAPTLAKTASAAAAVVGDVVTFTITATNPYADPLTDVVITDVLPAGMTYQTHVVTLGSVGTAGQTVTWSIPSLPAMGSAQLTLAISLSQQGPLTNTVTAPGATSASASILVLASAVTHFRMDEPVDSWSGTPGEVIDSGGTGLHGRRIPSPTSSSTNVVDPTPSIVSQHPGVIGGFCNAAFFDRQAIVEVADSPLFDYTTQLSASAWIYPTAYPSGSSDLYSILSNDVNYEFHLNPQGRLYWWWNSSTLTSATTIPLNQWTHVAITFDSSAGVRRQRIYINGVMDGNTNNWQGTLQPNNCNFYIGGDVATGAACDILSARNFPGMIDEVKLYSFELSPEEVVADMTLGRACSGTFDHVRIEHDGSGSICAPERVSLRACMDSDCTALYPGNVTVNLSPSGWVDGNTFTFSGGIASRQLSRSTPGTITLGTNSVSPTPAFATRCFNGSTETCQMTFASASCAFDAVEPGAQPQTPIYTKLAGVPFNIDVLALLSSTTINTAYTGTVAVDLVDTSSSACPTGSGLTAASNITYVAGDAGRKAVSFNYSGAARNVRVRATVGASAPACSTDNFAIRPQAFAVSSTNATNFGMGGAPVITAGAAFNLTAASVAGYDGTPLVDSTKVVGTPNAGALGGTFNAAPAGTGTASSSSFTYTEVGHFGLNQHAVYDSTFTLVDQPDDCNSGFSNTLSGGKYGCSIGSNPVAQATGSSGFGRFVPARLNISNNSPTFTPACGANFTYLGQPFSFTTDPVFTVTALNTMGNVTTNYAGGYWNLTSTLAGRSYSNNAATTLSLSAPSAGSVAWTGTNVTDGVGTATLSGVQLQYEKLAVPHVPFDADVALNLTAGDLTDGDGVCYDPESDGTCNAYTVGGITGTELRFGRLRAQNTYGPELMTLNVPLQAEYYTAGDYFTVNVLDGCTVLTDGSNLLLSTDGTNWVSGDSSVTIGGGTSTATLGSAAPLSGGDAGLSFSAPDAGNTGQVDLRTNIGTAYPWLLHDWDGDGIDDEAQARINFGLYRGSPRHIYLRERY